MAASCVGRTTGFACATLVIFCVAYTLGSGKMAVVRVAGGSMSPTLWPGDVCLVTHVERPAVSDVVLFAPPGHGTRVLHRVRALEASGVVTQGDANPIPDRELVPPSAVIGRVSVVVPVGRVVRMWHAASGR